MIFRLSNLSLAAVTPAVGTTRRVVHLSIISLLTFALFLMCTPSSAAIGPAGQPALNAASASPGNVTVTDTTGKPISGVAVMSQPRPEMLLPENLKETTATTTDASGVFSPPPREVGGTHLVLRKPGLEAVALDAGKPAPRNIKMRSERTVSGKVLSPDGHPIPGALAGPLSFTPGSGNSDANLSLRQLLPRQVVQTDASGAFHFSSLPPESLAIQFSAPGHTPRLAVFDEATSELKVSLETGGATISGSVIGSKDKTPKPGIAIEATGNSLLLSVRTDLRGAYTFNNIPPGTWTIRPAGGGPVSGTQSRSKIIDIEKADQVVDLPLVLNQGVMLAGRAIDMKTSQGLGGINITLAGYAGSGAKAVLTDPDGAFLFDNLDSLQDVIIRFDPIKFVHLLPGGGYRDYFDISNSGDTNFDLTTLTIPLHRRFEVKGKVRDAAGQVAADVEIRLQSLDAQTSTPSKSGPGLLTFATASNSTGDFRAGVYPSGRYKVWAQQDALVSQVEIVEAYTTAPVPSVELRMDKAAQLEGLVTDSHDAIVTGAVVIAWPANGLEPEEQPIPGRENYEYSKTDKQGKFLLSGLRGEPLILRASHPSYVQPVHLPLDPTGIALGTSSGLVLKFPAGGEFAVTVTDETGQTLSGAEVQLDYQDGLDGQRVRVVSDSYGRASVGALPADRLDKLVVNHAAYAPFESEAPISLPQKDFKVSLKKRGSIVAAVRGTGPVPGVPVEIFLLYAPLSGSTGSAAPEQGFDQTARAPVVAGKASFPNLPPGWYKVAFADSGAYAESKVVRMEAGGGIQNLELSLPQGNHLTGTVIDKQTGEGVAGANLTIRPAVDSQIVTERAQQNVTTGEGGVFELYNVGSGQLHALVIAAGYPDLERNINFVPGESLNIELSAITSTLEGRVTVGGSNLVEGALIILSKAGGDHSPVATAVTDEAGTYKMEGFPASSYALTVEAPIGAGENITRKSLLVSIEEEQVTQDVNFESLVSVQGKVRLNGKLPERGSGESLSVLFSGTGDGMESKMIKVADDGAYSVQLEPGDYTVSLEDREGRPITIKAGAGQTINLDF